MLAPTAIAWLCFSRQFSTHCNGDRSSSLCRLALGLIGLGAAAAYAVTPFAAETEPGTLNTLKGGYLPCRFGLSFFAIAALSLVVLLDDLQRKLRSLVEAGKSRWQSPRPLLEARTSEWLQRSLIAAAYVPQLLFAGLIISQLGPGRLRGFRGSWTDAVLIAADYLLASCCLWHLVAFLRAARQRLVVAAAALLLLAGAIGWLGQSWELGFADHYDAHFHTKIFSRLNQEPFDEMQVCCCTYQYYPFLGGRRQFRASRPFLAPTYESLLEYLKTHGSTHIATTNRDFFSNGRYRQTKAWLESHPERFEPVEISSGLSLYRVRREMARVEGP
jgi:hypothetical protein